MSTRRDVWRIDRAGSLARLSRRGEDLADPAPGQARVAVRSVGLNFADLAACLGLYSATPRGSFIPGLEFAGVIEAVGPGRAGDGRPRPGDLVGGVTRFGGYATAVNASLDYLWPIRPGWSFSEAAALPVQGLTAWYGLVYKGGVRRGDVVLVQSAAGGVGLHALSILTSVGARTIAAVGHESKRQWLIEHRGLAPEQIIVRHRGTFGADLDHALAAIGANGCDLVFDAVVGPYFQPAYDRLRPEGRMVVYGAADLMPSGARVNYFRLAAGYVRRPRVDPLRLITENRSVLGFNLIWLFDRVEALTVGRAALDALLTSPPFVGRRFPFAEARAAMRHLQSGRSVGKVVLMVD
jgi:synaptic vesicle membrane protein VAT-1